MAIHEMVSAVAVTTSLRSRIFCDVLPVWKMPHELSKPGSLLFVSDHVLALAGRVRYAGSATTILDWMSGIRNRQPPAGRDDVGSPRGLRPYWALIAAAFVLPLLIFAVAAWQNWRDIAAFTAGRAERRAALVAEHALKVFEVNEQVLRRVADRVRGLRWDEIESSGEIGAFLTTLTAEIDHVQGAGLIGPDGRLRAVSGAFPVPHLDLSDRDYFREPLASEGPTYVAGPTIGRLSGQPFFRLSRRWDDPLGTAGVVFISMAPDYFTEFYRKTTLGEDAVTMVRADGIVLSREPPVTTGVERLSPLSGLMLGIGGGDRGIYRTVSRQG
jgi:two-component system NtrC family sensor kinase